LLADAGGMDPGQCLTAAGMLFEAGGERAA